MISFLIFLVFLESVQLQQKPPRPPPCKRRGGQCAKSGNFKWIFCNNEWKRATMDDCKAVFVDPELEICNRIANGNLFSAFPNAEVFVWLGNGNFAHCEELNTCFCPVCGANTAGSNNEGIIVVGGYGGTGSSHYQLDSSELLINNNHHCYLPPIP